jgi:hypothetical protein
MTPQPTEGPLEAYKHDLINRCAIEAEDLDDFTVPLHLDLNSALALVGNLQLALRHPDNTGSAAAVARQIIDGLIARMTASGLEANAELARLGDNPDYDAIMRTCRVCGCTERNACPGGCSWVDVDLCSQCDLRI